MSESTSVDKAVFLSPLAEALHGKRLGATQSRVSDLLVGYSILSRRLQRALKRCLASLEVYQSSRQNEGWDKSSKGNTNDHLDDFLDVVYAASELFELYETEIIKLLNPSSKIQNEYRTIVRKLKRFSTILCNKCKHNYAFLQSIEITYESGEIACGYVVYHMRDNVAVIVSDISPPMQAFSLVWSLNRVVTDILQTDMAVADLINSMTAKGNEELVSLTYTLPYLLELQAIERLPAIGVPKESSVARITIDPREFVNIEGPSPKTRFFGRGKMRVFVDLIAPATAVRLPYVEGEMKVTYKRENDPHQPVPAFFRVVLADVEVTDD
ncbi:hypothetical protein [Glacieibacterium frigidum]|uniref:Uncharacterized protein n=1 Tax=Glacieibacterium frigidum TaxID=2593303 RepID=A0A552UER9_9SPHN|nr:hypothetical protein [Glacieibacterium frigidum]TRW16693.1 hypothetical protein FMM06_00285 [Glacieibacterium frigidum]